MTNSSTKLPASSQAAPLQDSALTDFARAAGSLARNARPVRVPGGMRALSRPDAQSHPAEQAHRHGEHGGPDKAKQ